MARKRYSASDPEPLLAEVIAGCESGDELQMSKAMLELITRGPMEFDELAMREYRENTDRLKEIASRVGPELQDFLRRIVLCQDDGPPTDDLGLGWEIDVLAPLTFVAQASGGRVRLAVARADLRDFIVLQFLLLVREVGIRNVRECSAPDCQRLFVKTYRREYCSPQCQKRVYMRSMRGKQRELEERRQRARRRRQREADHG